MNPGEKGKGRITLSHHFNEKDSENDSGGHADDNNWRIDDNEREGDNTAASTVEGRSLPNVRKLQEPKKCTGNEDQDCQEPINKDGSIIYEFTNKEFLHTEDETNSKAKQHNYVSGTSQIVFIKLMVTDSALDNYSL